MYCPKTAITKKMMVLQVGKIIIVHTFLTIYYVEHTFEIKPQTVYCTGAVKGVDLKNEVGVGDCEGLVKESVTPGVLPLAQS